jgi:hypothetical protein
MSFLEGKTGSVPIVDVDDVRAVWTLYRDMQRSTTGQFAIGVEVIESVCKAGADIGAVYYRVMHFLFMPDMLDEMLKDLPVSYVPHGPLQIDEEAFKQAALTPLEWPKPGISTGSFVPHES